MHTVACVASFLSLVIIVIICVVRCGCVDKWKNDFNEKVEARKKYRKLVDEERKSLTVHDSQSDDEDIPV